MTTMRSPPARSGPGDDYDRMPYPSLPFAETQPARLAALAALFGIDTADVATARVLELGCAAGGNIIPLALRFPAACFTGIDLSRRHISDGRHRIAALGLSNVKLLDADLEVVDLGAEQFDYIICNGVFSWVSEATRTQILRLCQRALAPRGLATISYNVMPGWHLRMAVRDLCLHYAGTEGSPSLRVSKARAALERLAAAAGVSDQPYHALLRLEAQRLRAVPDAYIFGEFLAQENFPMSIGEFASRTDGFGLHYLCETDLRAAVPTDLGPGFGRRLLEFEPDRVATEQEIDFLTGRLFRRSVLVPRQVMASAAPHAMSSRLRKLHVRSPLRLDQTRSSAAGTVFVDDRNRPVTATLPALARGLHVIAAAFPATVPVEQLLDPASDDMTRSRICQALLDIVVSGRASLSVVPLHAGRAADACPNAWPLARIEAAAGQPWLTTLAHHAVPSNAALCAILPLLDGTRDRATLRARVSTGLLDGMFRTDPPLAAEVLADTPARDRAAGALLDLLLGLLERDGLLQAAETV